MTLAIGRERETILSLEKKEREMNAKVGSLVKYQVVSYLVPVSFPVAPLEYRHVFGTSC